MEKKKHIRKAITLETKIAILDCLAKGEGSTAIGKKFNFGESTIRAIKNNEVAIRKSVMVCGTKLSSKFTSYSRDDLLEKTERALVIWIEELNKNKIPISGNLIKEKALEFYEKIRQLESSTSRSRSDKEFVASNGWLTGFVKRSSFHNLNIRGETASADEKTANQYSEKLVKIIEDGGYSTDQAFNADETGLYWKKMPSRTDIAKSEKKASEFKAGKDRVTLLLCGNASGDRILKPLLINRSLRLRALKGKDLDELLEDNNDIIGITLDTVEEQENENESEDENPVTLTASVIREGLQLSTKLANHFIEKDDNSERAYKFQRELQNCISGYRELYKKIAKPSQSLITDYFVKGKKSTCKVETNFTCEESLSSGHRSGMLTISSSDESDFEPVRKLCRTLSYSDHNSIENKVKKE